jgi:adenylate kinase/phosphoserine phosphatase
MNVQNKLYMIVGIPGSGKTTLARKLAEVRLNSHKLSCSELLKIVMKEEGVESWSGFDALDKSERYRLVHCVTRRLSDLKTQHETIYADAHMLVKNRGSGEFDVGLTRSDAEIIDGLIFLDTSPETVQKNTKRDNGLNIRNRPHSNIEQIQCHRQKELEAAQCYCEEYGLPLYLVDNKNNDYTVEDVLTRLDHIGALVPATEKSLDDQVSSHLEKVNAEVGPALILDGDRTFSEADAFRLFDSALGLRDINRQAFEKFGYHLQSFSTVSGNWKKVSIYEYLDVLEKVAKEIQPRQEWFEVLSNTPRNVPVFLVTAGVPQLWQRILNDHQFDHVKVIGGTHPYLDKELITHDSKSHVVSILKNKGYWVCAAGDSPIDAPMLNRADLAMVVPDGKGSLPLISELVEHNLEQRNSMSASDIRHSMQERIAFSGYQYLNMLDSFEILNAHSLSKVIGINRFDLKISHKNIGGIFIRDLCSRHSSFTSENTVVVGVERSGRYLAEGAVDVFDCPLLSALPMNTLGNESYDPGMVIPHLDFNKANIIIFDSVIHTGGTVERVLAAIPDNYEGQLYVFCTEVNEASLGVIEKLRRKATFYCLRVSCRKERPVGCGDMGAKLYGTLS